MDGYKNQKIAFVILNYNGYVDTINCVFSILHNIVYPKIEVIIVDNGSQNNSVEIIKKEFMLEKHVYILENGRNLGFALGNNIGAKYAKEKLKADFLIVSNNDTLFMQKDFVFLLLRNYDKTNFAILGPRIIDKKVGNDSSNPMREYEISNKELFFQIYKYKLLLLLNYMHIDILFNIICKKVICLLNVKKNTGNIKKKEMVQLHGSCLVFSPKYFSKFTYCFDERTFLYFEEYFLFHRILENNLKSVFEPDIEVIHLGDRTTDALIKSPNKKRRFIYKNLLKSMLIYYKDIK